MKQRTSAWGHPHAPALPRWGRMILSAFLAVALCLSLLPPVALAAAPESRQTIQPGASTINGWSQANGYDYIYLGNYNNSPVKWRVLSANGDGAGYYYDLNTNRKDINSALFLLSEDVLDSVQYNTSNRNKWTSSAALDWCTKFAKNGFASTESKAILETYQKKDTAGTFNGTAYTAANQVANAAKVFFLYAGEATKEAYGLGTADARKASADWWLITAAKDRVKNKYLVGAINKDTGEVTPTIATESKGTRPALNLDKNRVLFTSAANNSAHKDGLTSVESYTDHKFKLTLKDGKTFVDGTKIVGGRKIWNNQYTNAFLTIEHKALKDISKDYTDVTAALTDASGKILYYGSVNDNPNATSSTVTLPNGLGDGTYTLSLYGEDWNGVNESDYATETPFTVEITIHDGTDGPNLAPRTQDGLLSVNEITGYDADAGYNYIYFGKFGADPILWRVLSTSGNATGANDMLKQGDSTVSNKEAMFLLSEYLLGQGTNGGLQFTDNAQAKNVEYKGSTAQAWCGMATNPQSQYRAFTDGELSAVLDTTKSDPQYAGKNWHNKVYKAIDNILENDKVFFLSAEEAANTSYGFDTEAKLIAYYNNVATEWWLRSALTDANTTSVGAVTYSSTYGWELCPKLATEHAPARPAFNLSKNDVLFVSAAGDAMKSGTADANLTAIATNTTSQWKLTLRDDSRTFDVTETTAEKFAGGTVTLDYTGAKIGTNEFISAILYGTDGKAAYYGQLKDLSNADSTGTVALEVPDTMAEGTYTLQLFNEHCNGANQTDYASAFSTVTLKVDNTDPVLSDFAVSRATADTASVTFRASEQGTYYYVVSDSATAPSIDTAGVGTAMTAGEQTLELTGVAAGKSYLHIVAKDVAGNVCAVQTVTILGYLPAPANAAWDSETAGKATWSAVEHASGYRVQLYKGDTALGSAVTVNGTEYTATIPDPPAEGSDDSTTTTPPATLPDNAITEAGTYSFRVTALGNGTDYSDSTAAESGNRLSSITVQPNENGTVKASARYAVTGAEITLTGEPNGGYRFDKWEITPADVTITENQFTMPGEAVMVQATFARRSSSSSPTYPVTTPDKTEHGSVTVSPKNAKQGSTVTITVTPDAGYVPGDLTVTDKNGKNIPLTKKSDTQYSFTMPTGGATVKASFVKDSAGQTGFVDVKSGDYFYDAVQWAVGKGVTNGTDATHFSPDATCTRAQIVTFLWRAAGSPAPKSTQSFADVPADSYYAKAVAWAVENGITNGTSETTFSPDATCTRAQGVTFLYRALGQKTDRTPGFTDVPADSYYADAVAWAAESGITNGISESLFGPENACTRAQIVTFLYRAYQGR